MRTTTSICFALLFAASIPMAGAGRERPVPPGRPAFDARLPASGEDRGGFVMRTPTTLQRAARLMLEAEHPGLTLHWDGLSGAPKWLGAAPGRSLSPPSAEDPETAARAFLRERATLFGITAQEVERLKLIAILWTDGSPHVHFAQRAGALEVFGSHVKVNLDADGAVRSAGATLFGGMRVQATALIAPAEALRIATADVYPGAVPPSDPTTAEQDGERKTVFRADGFGFAPEARLVVFPEAEGERLAWEVRVSETSLFTSYAIVVDAADGAILYRENTTLYAEAAYLNAESPDPMTEEFAPDAYARAAIPAVTPQSPAGWIAGAGTALAGNNASSHVGHRSLGGLSEPTGIYDYPFNTPRSALVNAWWWANEAHDRFYAIGFNEAAGNFQQDNFGLGGVGGDAMQVVGLVNHPRYDSYFTPVTTDGGVSSINMAWGSCRFCADHDGLTDPAGEAVGERAAGYNRFIVTHEYTHGVSVRLVGGGITGCMNEVQSGALSEAWSDIFTASFYDTPAVFKYLYEGTGFGRHLVNDLTYDQLCEVYDFGSACQYHSDGLIWTGTLWDLRRSMIALDPGQGLDKFNRLVLKGEALTPCHPSYLDAKQALLTADDQLFGSAHRTLIQNVFAARGMGAGASTTGSGDSAPVADYTVPAADQCVAPSAPTGLTAAADGDNRIRLAYSATGAQAVEVWRDDLDNAVDRAVRIGSTSNLGAFVDETVQGGKSYRYHLIAFGTGGLACRSAPSATADASATGACSAYPRFAPNLTAGTADPACGVTLSWNAAQPGCPGAPAPIVYDIYRGPAPGFEPSERLHIATTAATSFVDTPPAVAEYVSTYTSWIDTPHYLVLARHGDIGDPPDHHLRGSAQVLQWVGAVPTLARQTVQFWDFNVGAQGWTTDNAADPTGGWVLATPSGTRYADILLAPDEPAGGSGRSWVTGDAGGPSNIVANDCDDTTRLISPVWDGTNGATIVSLDYWNWLYGNFWAGMDIRISNGTAQVQVPFTGLMTAQIFDAPGRYGWQRSEIDLARWIAPSPTMQIEFVTYCGFPVSEFGIDNVRVERAVSCARSGLRLQSVTVDDTPAGWGNGNGVLEPGETARLQVRIVNAGSAVATAPQGTLRIDAAGGAVHEAVATFPDVAPSAAVDSFAPHFTVTAPAAAVCNDTLGLAFEFVDAAGTISRDWWHPEYGSTQSQLVFSDTFETDKGWGVQGMSSRGRFQRGDPVGTTDGGNAANPENDSPNDAGAQCYVTENGTPGGAANLRDVDGPGPVWPRLTSPNIDLTGYKRATLRFDLWVYDSSTSDPWQDYLECQAYANTDVNRGAAWGVSGSTGGWTAVTNDLSHAAPMKSDFRVAFIAYDNGSDHIVEVGVDNVVIDGHRQVCSLLGIDGAPNGVGSSVRVAKSGPSAVISWTASPIDATHDGAAYYELFASQAPSGGFGVSDTATTTEAAQPLAGGTRFYLVTAVNAAGTSGDEPAP